MTVAPLWPRFGAHLIDFILLNAVEVALEFAISKPFSMGAVTEQIVGVILSLGLCYYYYVTIPTTKGTTLGKKVFGLYVVDRATLEPFTQKQAISRALGYILSYVTVGCGFLMAIFHPEKRALHDLIAGTIVVRKKVIGLGVTETTVMETPAMPMPVADL